MYVRVIQNRRDAARLLAVERPPADAPRAVRRTWESILNTALNALEGEPVDEELWRQLKPLFADADWSRTFDLLRVLRRDRWDHGGKDKARSVLQALERCWQAPDARQPAPVMFNSWLSRRASLFDECVRFFHEARPVTGETIQALERGLTPIQQKCLIMAKALRGDRSAGAEYRRIMVEDKDPELRLEAVMLFEKLPREEGDLALLERIAATDSYRVKLSEQDMVESGFLGLAEADGTLQPIRFFAREVLRILRQHGG